jgi:hypothetical protein
MLKISQTCLADGPMGRDAVRPQPTSQGAAETPEPATSAVPADLGDESEDLPPLSVPVPTAVVGTTRPSSRIGLEGVSQ